MLWSFWVACGLAATGAIAPVVLEAGDIGRASGVAIPFGIAAVLMAAIALTYPSGKALATALYILAWLAVVYGILRMIAIPLQQAVAGSCLVSPSGCAAGFSSPFSGGQGIATVVGIVAGGLAVQVGYFGLRALYRTSRKQASANYASVPPTRVIGTAKSEPTPQPPKEEPIAPSLGSVEEPAPDPVPAPQPSRTPRARRNRKPAVEPASQADQAELPAHPDPAELPPHSEPAELPPHSDPTSSS